MKVQYDYRKTPIFYVYIKLTYLSVLSLFLIKYKN